MKTWKPKDFKAEYPSPEDGCAFVMGGSLDGEIMQSDHPLPQVYQHYIRVPWGGLREPKMEDLAARVETYRLEVFCCGRDNQRNLFFYIHESDDTAVSMIRSFTALCMFKRDALRRLIPEPAQ